MYIQSVEQNIGKNIKDFWTYISHLKTKSEISTTMFYQPCNNPESICNIISEIFLSVYKPHSSKSASNTQWQPPPNVYEKDVI